MVGDRDFGIKWGMNALKYTTAVRPGGKVELDIIGIPEGTPIEVVVLYPIEEEEFEPIMLESLDGSLSFWDGPADEESLSAA